MFLPNSVGVNWRGLPGPYDGRAGCPPPPTAGWSPSSRRTAGSRGCGSAISAGVTAQMRANSSSAALRVASGREPRPDPPSPRRPRTAGGLPSERWRFAQRASAVPPTGRVVARVALSVSPGS